MKLLLLFIILGLGIGFYFGNQWYGLPSKKASEVKQLNENVEITTNANSSAVSTPLPVATINPIPSPSTGLKLVDLLLGDTYHGKFVNITLYAHYFAGQADHLQNIYYKNSTRKEPRILSTLDINNLSWRYQGTSIFLSGQVVKKEYECVVNPKSSTEKICKVDVAGYFGHGTYGVRGVEDYIIAEKLQDVLTMIPPWDGEEVSWEQVKKEFANCNVKYGSENNGDPYVFLHLKNDINIHSNAPSELEKGWYIADQYKDTCGSVSFSHGDPDFSPE